MPAIPAGNAFAATPSATAPTSAAPTSAAPAHAPAAQAEPVQRPASPVRAGKAAEQAPVPAGSAAEPCAPLALAPLGDPGGAVGSATIAPQGTGCFEVVVTKPGMHRLLVSDQYASASLSSGGSNVVCGDPWDGSWCELAAGTYTLSVYNSHWEPITNRVSLVPLMAAPGCPAVVGTSYDSAPATGIAADRLGIVCHAFTAAPGERITAGFQLAEYGDFGHWITDDTGKRICDSADCVLPAGVGGYRVLAEVQRPSAGFPAAYTLKVRRLSNPAGCAPVAMTAYGSAPAQAAPQTGCRTFTPAVTGRYNAHGIDAQGGVSGIAVYAADGSTVCADGRDCSLAAGVPYTLLTDVAVRILSRTATAGCENGVALARDHKGTSAVPGEVDCLNLPVPQGAHVAVLSDGAASITVVDAKGDAFCEDKLTDGTCVLGGTAPYRALVSKIDPSDEDDAYRLVVHRTDAPSACRTFLPGDFTGKPVRMSVKTSTEVFADCLSIAAGNHSARELFQIQRVSGDSNALVSVLDEKGKPVCTISVVYGSFSSCALTAKAAHTVLVRSRNLPAEFALTRLDVTATARGCVPTAAAAVGGPSTGGVPATPGTFLCHQVTTADAADTLHLNARDAQGTARLLAYEANGEVVCDYYAAGCAVTGSTRYQVLVQVPEGKTAAPAYRLDALRIGTAAGPAPECVEIPNVSYGFGPLTATLSEKKTAICAVLPTATSDRFDLKFTPAGTFEQSPTPWMYDRSDLKNGCWAHACSLPNGSPKGSRPSTLVIGLPEKPAQASTAVRVYATCAAFLCGPDERTVATVGPSTVGRGKVTMTVTGSALREDTVVEVHNGSFGVRSTSPSVAPDRRRMTVALDLTNAPLGPLSVNVFAHGVAYGMASVTVVAPIRSTAAPTVTGTAVVGGTVKATIGSWLPVADAHTYRWYADGKSISGATASSYTLPSALQGKQLTVVVTARKAGHPAVKATSAAVLVKGAAPKATKAPSITGTAKVGSVLTANRGTWTPTPTSYTYKWYADGKLITGATRTTFTLTSAQRGKRITVKVTAYRTGHLSGTATSGARGPVAG
ncbi:Tat pathway signal protein [Streptomyces sp. AP-93]|uniref:Tat pathway signal protein n=1 Tax=Streptomyces sp. AP-93 TaxID=2929048 RepID=UPI001FB00BE9|nr:Tat pathway signal protein [Streptomyces sp. AP-93]MCJ0869684.1 Tat pathway signal protein [Streptomyces sp. AP-93]